MPQFPQAGPFNPQDPLVLPQSGIVTPSQSRWLLGLAGQIGAIQAVVNGVIGTNFLPLASQPALAPADAGYVMYVTDYAHLVYWDGTAWQWMDGDRPARFDDFAADPGVGWALCDGAATDVLVVGGGTLTTSAFTTPDLAGTAAYRKSAGSYSGTIHAKTGSTGTGSTGTGTTGTGTSGDESSHTHASGSLTATVTPDGVSTAEYVTTGGIGTQQFHVETGGTTAAGSAHNHSVPGLSVPALSIPALGVGSIEMANLGCLPYVRR